MTTVELARRDDDLARQRAYSCSLIAFRALRCATLRMRDALVH
jgi:hypothetical protein